MEWESRREEEMGESHGAARKNKTPGVTDWESRNEAETESIGAQLAEHLQPGDVVALRGGLGMGKTAFVRGLARGLGCPGRVTSPTFTIVNEYEGGRLPLFHFDLYRIQDAGELFDLGWEDYLDRGGVCAVEWSERVWDALPPGTVTVTLERSGESDSQRRMIIDIEGIL